MCEQVKGMLAWRKKKQRQRRQLRSLVGICQQNRKFTIALISDAWSWWAFFYLLKCANINHLAGNIVREQMHRTQLGRCNFVWYSQNNESHIFDCVKAKLVFSATVTGRSTYSHYTSRERAELFLSKIRFLLLLLVFFPFLLQTHIQFSCISYNCNYIELM